MITSSKSDRIELVDALRGFALLAIVLLHNLEHFNLYYFPSGLPQWLKSLDSVLWESSFFLMGGKAFATFALLFGFSFFIQIDNARQRGTDFRGRFAWRMFILILFAQLHTLFYSGDILFLYAFMGLFLIIFAKASNKTIFFVALFLLLQPFEWVRFMYALLEPDFVIKSWNGPFYNPLIKAMKEGSFLDVMYTNMTVGQLWNNFWQIENGRLFQIPALFMFGLLLGRLRCFVYSLESVKFWKKVLLYAVIVFIPLYCVKTYIPGMIENKTALAQFNIAVASLFNFFFMCILVSSFSLLWFKGGDGYRFQRFIIPYGRMSLTNYITQSIIGCFVYLNYGLNLYKEAGATVSILIGVATFIVQLIFSTWWLSCHKQGPLEYVWTKLTWINRKTTL